MCVSARKASPHVTAAGRSRRFNGDKLAEPFLDKPLALHVVTALENIPFCARIAVVSDTVLDFAARGYHVVENPDPSRGQARSLCHGVSMARRQGCKAVLVALAGHARRELGLYSRAMDPGLLDRRDVLDALRRFAVRPGERRIRILLQDPATPQRSGAPLLPLAQRLPSVFAFREVRDPVDARYPSAYAFNDTGGACFRPLGHRFDGEGGVDDAPVARRLQLEFDRVWERSRICSEYRAL